MYLDDILAYEPRDEAEAGDKAMFLEYLRLFPDTILTRENKIAHLTASGFVVNGDGTRVLMAHHNLYRVWAWTGATPTGTGICSPWPCGRPGRRPGWSTSNP